MLTGADHAAFHATTRELFEARSVYDSPFGYNLARRTLERLADLPDEAVLIQRNDRVPQHLYP